MRRRSPDVWPLSHQTAYTVATALARRTEPSWKTPRSSLVGPDPFLRRDGGCVRPGESGALSDWSRQGRSRPRNRRGVGRLRLGGGPGHHSLRSAGAERRGTGHREDRGAGAIRCGQSLSQRVGLRLIPRRCHCHRNEAGCRPDSRRGQLSADPRHVHGFPIRLHVRRESPRSPAGSTGVR